jgi:very-short-patch-repair endonuclease
MWNNRKLELTVESVRKRWLVWNGKNFPYNPNHLKRAENMRKNMMKPEKKLRFWFLQKHACKFYRQRMIDHFIVDFYCSQYDLVIEIDGESHYTDEAIDYDVMRTELLELYWLRVVRFTNNQVMNEFEAVCEKIDMRLKNPSSV